MVHKERHGDPLVCGTHPKIIILHARIINQITMRLPLILPLKINILSSLKWSWEISLSRMQWEVMRWISSSGRFNKLLLVTVDSKGHLNHNLWSLNRRQNQVLTFYPWILGSQEKVSHLRMFNNILKRCPKFRKFREMSENGCWEDSTMTSSRPHNCCIQS